MFGYLLAEAVAKKQTNSVTTEEHFSSLNLDQNEDVEHT